MSNEHGDDWVEFMSLGVIVVVIVLIIGLGLVWLLQP